MISIFAILLTQIMVSGDMTPDEQASAMRRIVRRGGCVTIRFSLYDLEACQCAKTGWLRLCDAPWYLDGRQICWGNWH